MTTKTENRWRSSLKGLFGRGVRAPEALFAEVPPAPTPAAPEVDISPEDPLLAYLVDASGAVEVEKIRLDSPAVGRMKAAGVKMLVPLVSQGELIGILNLGPRLSEQEYSSDDRKLLNDLASQTAPAVRVAQLVREQQREAEQRERIAQELRVARRIQQTFLPRSEPDISGYGVATFYRPAREVGGDFYDFLTFEDGRLGLIVGDVTDKGVPAALVMATTRTLLHAAAQRVETPGSVLERVNEVLVSDIPRNMFVTCLYAILDPLTGHLVYANAGHDLPYHRSGDRGTAGELRARGMPLGLMPGMQYEEKEAFLDPGDTVLFYSDGLVEAHDPRREMFGFPRLQGLVGAYRENEKVSLVDFLLSELDRFVGEGWEQEDDITLVTLERSEKT